MLDGWGPLLPSELVWHSGSRLPLKVLKLVLHRFANFDLLVAGTQSFLEELKAASTTRERELHAAQLSEQTLPTYSQAWCPGVAVGSLGSVKKVRWS